MHTDWVRADGRRPVRMKHMLSSVVTILSHMIYVTGALAQESHYVFNLAVTYDAQEFSVNFSMDRFIEFYRCLCKATTASCTAYVELHKVIYIQENHLDRHQTQLYTYYNRHVCKHVRYENAVTCSKLQDSQVNCSNTQNCLTYGVPNEVKSACTIGRADLVWKLGQHVSGNYVYGMIEVKPCQPECVVINMETSTQSDNVSSASSSNTTTVLPFLSTVVNSNTTLLASSGSDENSTLYNSEDNVSMLVGLLGASIIVVAITVIIGVLLWRRRQSSPLAKSSKDISQTTHDTPTLIQLHHIDVVYANDDSLYAGIKTSNTNESTDVEVDSCWSQRFSDSTEYEPDFSDFYNDSNISLEAPGAHTNASQETKWEIYENYTRPIMASLGDSDHKFDKSLPRDDSDGRNVIEIHDELIYEDFDHSGFDQVGEENSGSEESTYSNISTPGEFTPGLAGVVTESSFRNTALCTLTSGLESSHSHDTDSESVTGSGYSKLNDNLSSIQESYNDLSGSVSLNSKSRKQPFPDVTSSEDSCQAAGQTVIHRLSYEPVEVIEVSLSPRLHVKNALHATAPIKDQSSPKGCLPVNKNGLIDAAAAQTQEVNHFKKARAYFELESHLRY